MDSSVSNLGGTFPRFFVLRLVDMFTDATCTYPTEKAAAVGLLNGHACGLQADKERCEMDGGSCVMAHDGYYSVNILCVLFGIVTFVWFIRPKVLHLQRLPMKAWRLAGGK